jgi:hypothetical protein
MEEAVHYAAAVMENTAYVCTWLVGFRSKEEPYEEHKTNSNEHKVPTFLSWRGLYDAGISSYKLIIKQFTNGILC